MPDVAADGHRELAEVGMAIADGQGVEQALGRMRMVAVAGIEDRRPFREAGEPLGHAVFAMAHDEGVGLHRFEGGEGVLERFALAGRGRGDVEIEHRGAESARGQFETRARARRGLEEQVDDGASGQQLRPLFTHGEGIAQLGGAVEQGADALAAEALEGDQVAQASIGVDLQAVHGAVDSLRGLENQDSRMICAASASMSAPCLRLAEPCARCAAKRRAASFEVKRSSDSCTVRA